MSDKKWWKRAFRSGGKDLVRTRDGSSKYDAVSLSANPTQANVVRSKRATPPTTPTIQQSVDASASLPIAVSRTTFGFGLHDIFDSVRDGQPSRIAEIDVVAVHGLNFKGSANHARETWTKGDKLWLKDFLPARLPKPARVMLFAYNSSPAIDAAAIRLDDHAKNLLQWLSLMRKHEPQRPLVFICHSLGGLVVKQALIEAMLDASSYKSIVDATRLLVFFATPHQGGNFANLGEIVAKIIRVSLQKPNNGILNALKQNSDEATRRFEQSRHLPENCLVVSFFEGESYGKLGIIVDKKSATLNLPGSHEKQVPIHADHSAICKFDSDSPACELILGTIAAEIGRALGIAQNNSGPANTLFNERDLACLTNLRVTDPGDDKKRIEDTKGGLLEDSYRWILKNSDFQQWHDDQQSRLLWIKSDPGKGKTMLLCGIIDELKKSKTTYLLSYFFCQAADSRLNNSTAVLRGLLYMLVNQQPSLISHIHKKHDYAGRDLFEDANARVALSEIFTNILQDPSLNNTYLIIDALDECVADLPKLLDFIVQKSCVSARVKWVVSSHNWPNIEERLGKAEHKVELCLELNAESISTAVSTFIQHKVLQLAERKKYDDKTQDAMLDYLSLNAHNTFLWVALVCQNLENISKWNVLAKLRASPPGLDSLYKRMMEQIRNSDDANLCKRILALIIIVHRPITLKELTCFIEDLEYMTDDLEPLQEIVSLCGSFLTVREGTIHLVHQSAKDFLLENMPGQQEIHHVIFSRSVRVMLRTLKRDMYTLRALGYPIEQVKKPDPDPLAALRYSCIYWIEHLCECDPNSSAQYKVDLQDGGIIDRFIRKKYLYWLEALSLCKSISKGVVSMAKLEILINGRANTANLIKLVQDARRFIMAHKWAIENSPLQAYASALVFSPACSLIRRVFKDEEPQWITIEPAIEKWSACLQTLEGHNESVTSVTFSYDSTRLASASVDFTVRIWDTSSGECLQILEGHSHMVWVVAFSHDSTRLASASSDKMVKIWDANSGECLQTLEGHSKSVTSVAFSHDSTRLASASDDKTVKIWDASSGECLQTLEGHSDTVSSVAFSHDSTRLASASNDEMVKIWDARSGECLQTLEGHSMLVTSVAFSHDSTRLASASYDNTVKLWGASSGECLQTLEGHSDTVFSVAFSHDSTRLASASSDDTVKIWDASSGECLQTLESHSDTVFSVAFSYDSTRLASASDDKTVKIWDASSCEYLQTPKSRRNQVKSVAFSHDLTCLASASIDETVKIWDASSGKCLQTLEGHSNIVQSVAFSYDSTRLASASSDGTVKIWDTSSGKCLQILMGYSYTVWSVAFSHDSTRLASASNDKTVKIWDTNSGECLRTLEGHSGSVWVVAFSHDSTRLASASSDDTVKIWDASSGECLRTLEGHSDTVFSVAFSHNSTRLASASDDKTVKIWDASSGECFQTLNTGIVPSNISFDTTDSYLHTDIGTIIITAPASNTPVTAMEPQDPEYRCGGLSPDRVWITYNSENVLWLPVEYRPSCSTMTGNSIGIGVGSGKVWICNFQVDDEVQIQRQTADERIQRLS